MSRVLVVCPGRGSYTAASLPYLAGRSGEAAAVLAACDAHRAAVGAPTITELDAAERFSAARHVAGEHASLLTFACSMADLADLRAAGQHEIVGVVGNSMGWYTALAAAGALSLADAIRLVDDMGRRQAGNVIGAQLMYPVTSKTWAPSAARRAALERAMAVATAEGATAELSIDLGTFWVLGVDAAGLAVLQRELPPETRGEVTYPARLPLHSAFHTSLMQATSDAARASLQHLAYRAPEVPLIDGRGAVFRPLSASPAALADYTLGHQVVRAYDLRTSLVTALQHCGPDLVVLLGPGTGLAGPVASAIVAAGWGGATSKAALQAREAPLLLSMGDPEQRARALAG